ncbi:MAG: hypothetical protein WBH86_01510 [Thermogutta sp.]
MRTSKAFILLSAIFGLATIIGCRMCASPHDSCGPVVSAGFSGRGCTSARAGSAFAVTAYSDHTDENSPGYASAPHVVGLDSDRRTVSSSKGPLPRSPHRPLTPEDIDPFVKLGIPPENILSVTDRPADEPIAQETSPSPQTLVHADPKQPKAPATNADRESVTSAGWTRIGERTSGTLR